MSLSISQSHDLRERRPLLLYALVCLSFLFFIWTCRVLPFQDLAQWTYQGVVFHDILSHGPLAEHYQLIPYPVPNSLATIVMGLLIFIFPIAWAPKILLSLYLFLYLYSASRFMGVMGKRSLIPLLFLFNYSIFMGNLNNNFALCFFLLALSALYQERKKELWLYALLLFLAHALGTSAFLVFAFFYLIFHRKTSMTKPLLSVGIVLTLLLLIYSAGHILTYSSNEPFIVMRSKFFFLSPTHYLNRLVRPLTLFVGEINYLTPLVSKGLILLNLATVPLLICGLSWKQEPAIKWTVAFFVVVLLFAPDAIGNMVGPGKRFALPLLFLLLAPKERLRPLFFTLLVVQQLYLHLYWPLAIARATEVSSWDASENKAKYFCSSYFEHAKHHQAAMEHAFCSTFDTSLVRKR